MTEAEAMRPGRGHVLAWPGLAWPGPALGLRPRTSRTSDLGPRTSRSSVLVDRELIVYGCRRPCLTPTRDTPCHWQGVPLVGCQTSLMRRVGDESETSPLKRRTDEAVGRVREAATRPSLAGGPLLLHRV